MAVPGYRRDLLSVHHRVTGSPRQDCCGHHPPPVHDLPRHSTILSTFYAHCCIFNLVLRLQVSLLDSRNPSNVPKLTVALDLSPRNGGRLSGSRSYRPSRTSSMAPTCLISYPPTKVPLSTCWPGFPTAWVISELPLFAPQSCLSGPLLPLSPSLVSVSAT